MPKTCSGLLYFLLVRIFKLNIVDLDKALKILVFSLEAHLKSLFYDELNFSPFLNKLKKIED